MYTRKDQMLKVKELDRKVEKISAQVEESVNDFLAENLAQVVMFNTAVLGTMRDILTENQQAEFFDVMSAKMDKLESKD